MGVVKEVKDASWFWDTEVIVKAIRKGYSIVEIPVTWVDSDTSKLQLVKDTIYMGLNIFKLWHELRFIPQTDSL